MKAPDEITVKVTLDTSEIVRVIYHMNRIEELARLCMDDLGQTDGKAPIDGDRIVGCEIRCKDILASLAEIRGKVKP